MYRVYVFRCLVDVSMLPACDACSEDLLVQGCLLSVIDDIVSFVTSLQALTVESTTCQIFTAENKAIAHQLGFLLD